MRDIVDIIRNEIVANINNHVKVISVVGENAELIEVKLCSLKWLKIGMPVISGVNAFVVTAIDYTTKEVTMSKTTPSSTLVRRDLVDIKTPTFVHGTRIIANSEWKAITNNSDQRLPLIWLYESIVEDENKLDSPIESMPNLRLFFLDWYNPSGSLVNENMNPDPEKQIRRQTVVPMLGLKDEFIRVINERIDIDINSNFYRKTISIFADEKEINNETVVKFILDENLGGVEIRPTLTVYKGVECC
jgi:hypothetical protein